MDTRDLTASARPELDLSIVVPLFNEEESLPELMTWIDRVLTGRAYEVVFVDDGSTDGSWGAVQRLKEAFGERVVGISFARNPGKSAALHTGFRVVRGRVVLTMAAKCGAAGFAQVVGQSDGLCSTFRWWISFSY